MRAAYRGRPSHPVLLARAAWAGVEVLRGDVGARALIATHLGRVDLAEVGGDPPEDVDTPEDYERLLARGLGLRITRVLPAPPERVFAALTTPERFAEWRGPRGFTAPSVELDPRPGGRLPDPDAAAAGHRLRPDRRVPGGGPPHAARLQLRVGGSRSGRPPEPRSRWRSAPSGARPRSSLEQRPFATEARRALHRDGWADAFDRLEALLGGGE